MIGSAIACAILILVHLSAGKLRFLDQKPRSRWLSAAGGVSIAYVFVHLLPQIAGSQRHFEEAAGLAWLENHVYLIALAGLVLFYCLEAWVRRHQGSGEADGEISPGVFWTHIGSFTLYNALIGYILAQGEERLVPYTIAMALHFLVTDFALLHNHEDTYRKKGRWVVTSGIAAGWGAAMVLDQEPGRLLAALIAFLGGAVILNVLKEELPAERESKLSAFIMGVLGYSLILLWI